MPEVRRKRRAHVGVTSPVGDSVVDVIDDPDLKRCGKKVHRQRDGQHLQQPRVLLGMCDPLDNHPTKSEQQQSHHERDTRVRTELDGVLHRLQSGLDQAWD